VKKLVLVIGITVLNPFAVMAGGSHSDGHHHEAEPAHHKDIGHGDDHHESVGNTGMVGAPAAAGAAGAAGRRVRVDMPDTMRFAFDRPLDLKRGEAVRYVVTNRGQVRHEFSIGSKDGQEAHRAMMRKMADMVHDDTDTVTVDPAFSDKLDPPEIDAILAWVQSHWSDKIYGIWHERDLAARGGLQSTRE